MGGGEGGVVVGWVELVGMVREGLWGWVGGGDT